MKNVCVLGFYDKGNVGDESYKIAFKKLFPKFNFTFVNSFAKVKESDFDLLFLGGGDVLNDGFLDQIKNVELPVYAISVNGNMKIDKAKFGPIKKALIRDKQTLSCFSKTQFPVFSPDASFVMKPNFSNGQRLLARYFQDRERYGKTVVVVVNAYLFVDYDRKATSQDAVEFAKFAYDLAYVADNTPYSFLFLPFSTGMPWDDRLSNAFVSSKIKFWQKNNNVYDVLTPQETLDLISACDATISSRLHSSIFSTIAAVPFIDLTHNHKNKWFLETIDYQNFIQYRNIERNALREMLNRILYSGKDISDALARTTEDQRTRLNEVTDVFVC
jgi:exopolysaccharide biosynthesis predicted pyruvyltransferase EpsI